MKAIIIVLGCLNLLELVVIAWLIDEEWRKDREEKRQKMIRDGFPWDWTMEQERKVQSAMELICDKCWVNKDSCSEERACEECAMCPVEDAVYILAGRRTRQ